MTSKFGNLSARVASLHAPFGTFGAADMASLEPSSTRLSFGSWGPDDLSALDAGAAASAPAASFAPAAVTAAPIPSTDLSSGQPVTTAFKLYTHTDLELTKQWHLTRLGDLETVWKDYTGDGVSVGIYDSGVQYAHWDLDGNYDASKHVVVDGKVYDGDYRPASGPHGTSVAGLIAAERNGQGGVGVAYDANITGVNIFDPYSEDDSAEGIFVNGADLTKFFDSIRQSAKFDVTNHSWGGLDYIATLASRTTEGTFSYEMVDALSFASETGRSGLGTVHVAAAGNDIIDGQADGWKTDRHVVTVGSYREVDGSSSYYVSSGAHLLVSAPSNDYAELGGTGQVTTDLLGRDGYNTIAKPGGAEDYTDDFGGTSGATPIVSGVVSLMLDANENLGWRDVRDILAASAKMPVAFETGQTAAVSTISGLGYILNNRTFQLNGSDANWNGGEMHYSNDYGYGAVDAYNAVRMAEAWSLFGDAKTSDNEASATTGTIGVGLTSVATKANTAFTRFADFVGTPTSFTFDVTQDIDVEHLDLTLDMTTILGSADGSFLSTPIGLKIKLIAPDETEGFIDLSNTNSIDLDDPSQTFTFGLSGFRGAETLGTWTLQFEQTAGIAGNNLNSTTVNSLKLDMYGSAPSAGDRYTYTDEFFTMASIAGESSRRTLSDTNGGVDWINAAALTGDAYLSLLGGTTSRFGGVDAFTLAGSALIENAVTGDGNDTIQGNGEANLFYGMRGNDFLNGRGGDDTLYGGLGNDQLYGQIGRDLLDGGDGNDRLDGGAGDDTMIGGTGNDTYLVDGAGDVVTESALGGTDTVESSVSYTLGAFVENLYLTGAARLGTGNALDNGLFGTVGGDKLLGQDGNDLLKGWGGDDRLYGGAGNDTLYGAEGNDFLQGDAGADRMQGDAGNDTYYVDNAGDQVIEFALSGQGGRDTVYSLIDYTLGSNVEDLSLVGYAVNGTGNALDNVIRGTGLANTLRGNEGADTIVGGAGNDTLYGGAGSDRFVVADGFGKDVIRDFGSGDLIDLAAYTLGGAPVVTDIGSDTLIDFGNGNTITLTGIQPDQINFTGSAFGYVG